VVFLGLCAEGRVLGLRQLGGWLDRGKEVLRGVMWRCGARFLDCRTGALGHVAQWPGVLACMLPMNVRCRSKEMPWLVLVVVVLVVLAVVALKLKQPEGRAEGYPYDKQALFSPAERSFLGVLDQAVGEDYRVFGKVRIADVVQPQRGMDKSSRQKALNRVSAKHFDFVLCAKGDLAVVCTIELDDQSHQERKRRARDAFLVALCQAISLPLIQVPAQHAYSVQELRATVLSALGQHQEPPAVRIPEQVVATPRVACHEPSDGAEKEVPTCPKCGATMVRRKAKVGSSAGQVFWGCSTFPKCRGILQEAQANTAESMA
jgi:hypothetical protein